MTQARGDSADRLKRAGLPFERREESNLTRGVARGEQSDELGNVSSPALLRDFAISLRDLWSKELELGRTEMREGIGSLKASAACVLLAAIPGLVSLVLLALAIKYLLDDFLPDWAAALVPAVALGGLSVAMVYVGLKRLSKPETMPDETVRSLKKDKQWLKQQLSTEH